MALLFAPTDIRFNNCCIFYPSDVTCKILASSFHDFTLCLSRGLSFIGNTTMTSFIWRLRLPPGHFGLLIVKVKSLSRVRLLATPWTVAHQVPLSMGFPRQEYWSGLPFPSPGDFPDPGIEPGSLALQADALTSEPPGKPHFNLWAHFFFLHAPIHYSRHCPLKFTM